MGTLERGTTSQINWTNDITQNGKNSQTKYGRCDSQLWMFQSNCSKVEKFSTWPENIRKSAQTGLPNQ